MPLGSVLDLQTNVRVILRPSDPSPKPRKDSQEVEISAWDAHEIRLKGPTSLRESSDAQPCHERQRSLLPSSVIFQSQVVCRSVFPAV